MYRPFSIKSVCPITQIIFFSTLHPDRFFQMADALILQPVLTDSDIWLEKFYFLRNISV